MQYQSSSYPMRVCCGFLHINDDGQLRALRIDIKFHWSQEFQEPGFSTSITNFPLGILTYRKSFVPVEPASTHSHISPHFRAALPYIIWYNLTHIASGNLGTHWASTPFIQPAIYLSQGWRLLLQNLITPSILEGAIRRCRYVLYPVSV